MLHHFIQKLTFQYKKIARFLGGSAPQTPWIPFLEFLPSLLDSMATVFSIFVSVLMQNSSPNTKKSLGELRPLPPPPPGTLSPGPLLGLRPRPRWPPAAGGCRPQTPALYLPITENAPPYSLSLDPPLHYSVDCNVVVICTVDSK